MTDPVELEIEDSELKDPVKDPEHDPLKDLDLDQADHETKPEKDPESETEPDASRVKPETGSKEEDPGQGQDRVPMMTPSEEERSATRTLIRQPEPVQETSDEEPEQV